MARSYEKDSQYGIGRTMMAMATLRQLGIAAPDQIVYAPGTAVYVRGDGSRVSDGGTIADWIWDVISIERLAALLDYLDGAEYANVYIQTNKFDGTYPNPRTSFATFSCIMWKPVLSGSEGVGVAASPYAAQTVRVRFVNLIEVGDYL